jgi:cell wall-associated NlpC family hydrolase
MRFGCLALILLVAVLACPGVSAAQPARLGADEPAVAPPPDPEQAQGRPAVVAEALRYLGAPYRWGGSSPSGFDCSGFVMYVFSKVGVALPHNAAEQYGVGRAVARSELAPGDVVFFNGLSHAGIYIGHGRFVHAPHSGEVVEISRLSKRWYGSAYEGARRY